MPQYTMFGREATLPVDWVFPTPSAERRTMYQWMGDMLEERQRADKSMIEVQGGRVRRKSEAECSDVQTINPEYQSGVSSAIFRS